MSISIPPSDTWSFVWLSLEPEFALEPVPENPADATADACVSDAGADPDSWTMSGAATGDASSPNDEAGTATTDDGSSSTGPGAAQAQEVLTLVGYEWVAHSAQLSSPSLEWDRALEVKADFDLDRTGDRDRDNRHVKDRPATPITAPEGPAS